jgi:DNA mismatch repair ATPase MutL
MVIEEKFMQIIQNMKLSDLETAALRLAIAENHPAIRNAIDSFRNNLDENQLMHSMKDAAKSVIQRTLSSRMGKAFDDEPEQSQSSKEVSPSKLNASSENAKETVRSPINKNYEEEYDEIEELDDEEDEEDNEDDDEDGDDDDDDDDANGGDDDEDEEDGNEAKNRKNSAGDDGRLLSQSARDHIFPILVQELAKENIVTKADARIILQEFAASNLAILDALNSYDRDNDMGQLVESLQQVVDSIRES